MKKIIIRDSIFGYVDYNRLFKTESNTPAFMSDIHESAKVKSLGTRKTSTKPMKSYYRKVF